jgi:hypothetical protein
MYHLVSSDRSCLIKAGHRHKHERVFGASGLPCIFQKFGFDAEILKGYTLNCTNSIKYLDVRDGNPFYYAGWKYVFPDLQKIQINSLLIEGALMYVHAIFIS